MASTPTATANQKVAARTMMVEAIAASRATPWRSSSRTSDPSAASRPPGIIEAAPATLEAA